MSGARLQKLEALLALVRRNRSAAPVRAGALAATANLAAAPSQTPHAPAVVASAPPARVEPPPRPPVEPPPPVTTPSWRPEPGSAVQARPTSVPPMEISDEDLLEVATLPPEPEDASVEVEVTHGDAEPPETDEEQPPASSRRFKVPDSLDEGRASASRSESEREIPVKTPPPESGPQEALPATGLEAPRMPDVAELEADLSGPPSMGPTTEQLGETIELEAPRGPELEIDVTVVAEEDVPAPAEELEVSLPRTSMQSGLYDVPVTAPPPAAPVTVEAPPPVAREAMTLPTRAAADDGPERTLRPALGATDVARVSLVTPSSAKTFVELLDASLGL